MQRTWIAAVLAVAVLAAGCTGEEAAGNDTPATFTVRPSVNQVAVLGAEVGAELLLLDRSGATVDTGTVDDRGTLVFRTVDEGDGYRVATAGAERSVSEPFEVPDIDGSLPERSFYADQQLEPGMNYITTRDGTTLSAQVYLPGPVEAGPYPTLVEYSGYNPSAPPSTKLAEQLGFTEEQCATGAVPAVACTTPAQPSSTLGLAMDFAVVAVNVRGTGCSGGAFDYFETLQQLDGYDVVETVAAQPWVKDNKVGMVGLSYPGISQLFTAKMQPPSLAAIAPLSVTDDMARGIAAPGGIFNDGFAFQWVELVYDQAEPYGQGWEQGVVDAGDETCRENQRLRGWNVNTVDVAKSTRGFYTTEVADPLNPSLFVDRINVPVFLSGSWQDEQTGPTFANLLNLFTNAPVRRFTLFNGPHADGYAPAVLAEWKAFLDFYVRGELHEMDPFIRAGAPMLLADTFGAAVPLPEDRFADAASFEEAKADYEAEPEIRVIWENGGDPAAPGAPVGRFSTTHEAWPVPVTATTLYFGPDGSLGTAPPSGDGESSFQLDPDWAGRTTWTGRNPSDLFDGGITYDWAPEPEGAVVSMVGDPLVADTPMLGTASVDLLVQSSTEDADLHVTLSEVRADGNEVYVQSGLMRASHRKPAEGSTELLPRFTGREEDASPLPRGEWAEVRVPVMPFGHVFREGSRIRVTVHSPGGNHTRWSFIPANGAPPLVRIAHSGDHPSKVVLPVLTDWPAEVTIPQDPPACPGLRAQPCRRYAPVDNRS